MRSFRIALIAAGLLILALDFFGIEEFTRSPYHGLQHNNLVFLQFDEDSPNLDSGLVAGDRITAVDGVPVRNITHFKYLVDSAPPGSDRVYSISRDDSSFEATIHSTAQPGNRISSKIAMSITALTFMVVGFYVIMKRPDILGMLFTVNCLIFSFLLTERPSTSIPMLHVLGEIFYDGLIAFLPAFFLHFFLIFPGKEIYRGSRRSRVGKLLYIPSSAIFLSMFVLALVNYSTEISASLLLMFNAVASIYWVLYMVGGVVLFIRTYMTSDKAQKVKFRIATIGLVAGTMPVTIVIMLKQFMPSLDIPFDHISMLFLSFISISFAYSILKHDAFDMRAVFSTGLAYVVVPVVLATIIYVFARGMLRKFPGSFDIRHLTMMVTALMLALIAFVMARAGILKLADRLFFKNRERFRERMIDFSRKIQFLDTINSIVEFTAEEIYNMLLPEYVHVFEIDSSRKNYVRTMSLPGEAAIALTSLPAGTGLVTLAAGRRQPLIVEYFDRLWSVNNLDRISLELISMLKFAVIVPLVEQNEMFGFILLGKKRNGKLYQGSDSEMLEILGERTSAAIRQTILYKVSIEKEKLEKEVHLASKIQQRLLPEECPVLACSTVRGRLINSREVGGDFYDFVELEEHLIGIAVADVSGKGIPASLLMTTLQASFRSEAVSGRSPGEVLSALNRSLFRRSELSKFATFFYAIYDDRTGILHYSNGGSFPPVLVTSDGRVVYLKRGGILVGVDPDSVYSEGIVKLRAGDVLTIYTDGVIDQENSREEYYGEKRFEQYLKDHASLDAPELMDNLYETLLQFGDGMTKDDMTVVVLKRNTDSPGISGNSADKRESSVLNGKQPSLT